MPLSPAAVAETRASGSWVIVCVSAPIASTLYVAASNSRWPHDSALFLRRSMRYLCVLSEVKIGHSNVSALRKYGSGDARYLAFGRHGMSALPNAAGGR